MQAELDAALWTLMPSGKPGTPTPEEWLASHLKRGDSVGVNPYLVTADASRYVAVDGSCGDACRCWQ